MLGYTRAYSTCALKCVLLPKVPSNEGNVLPIRIDAPEGSFLNPRQSAAVGARATVGRCTTSAMLNTLALALPDRVPAESANRLHSLTIRGRTEGDGTQKPVAAIFFFSAGFGARPGSDGPDTLSFPTNESNMPVEVLESVLPVRIHEKTLRLGSGGAGQWRGGDGQRVVLEVVNPEGASMLILSQRLRAVTPLRREESRGAPLRLDHPGEARLPRAGHDADGGGRPAARPAHPRRPPRRGGRRIGRRYACRLAALIFSTQARPFGASARIAS